MISVLAASSTAPAASLPLGLPAILGILGFVLSLIALGWQLVRYSLDGGRVKVYLNAAVLEKLGDTTSGLFTNHDGRWPLEWRGERPPVPEHFEVASLVVENPGRIAVTVTRPSIYAITASPRKALLQRLPGNRRGRWRSLWHRTSFAPMRLKADELGSGTISVESVVRLEPYDRVEFLLNYWPGLQRLRTNAGGGTIRLRGGVQVPGKRAPRLSARRRAWTVSTEDWTGIVDRTDVSPRTVMWRALHLGLSEEPDADAAPSLPRYATSVVLQLTMARFAQEPDGHSLSVALAETAANYGKGYSAAGLGHLLKLALDRERGHLSPWKS